MRYQLVIYSTGTAALMDPQGNTLWTSDNDDQLGEVMDDEFLIGDDGEKICDYLTDAGYLAEGIDVDIIEDNDDALDAGDDGDDDGDEEEGDEGYTE